ncbi:MAG: metal-dependent transcriptional regulator, partial [Clostridiales bacterium]|nr:metal-dependent transcriptional regulator [Clostridiales bacterium]
MALHESGEDYLETIYRLAEGGEVVHAVDIAKRQGVSKPSVTRAVRILQEAGLVTIGPDGPHIRLTPTGSLRARDIVERHSVLTQFLLQLGVSADIADKDACRMEHDLSPETFAA